MSIIKKLTSQAAPNDRGAALGTTILRVFAGLAMAFAHGLGKIPPPEKFITGVEELGFPAPLFFAWCAGLAEFAGGILLAIGFLTRPSALFMAFTMGVAAFARHAADPFQKKELSLLYLAIALFFFFRGAGPWSLDARVGAKAPTPAKKPKKA